MGYDLGKQVEDGILATARKHDICKLILFGSRARGTSHERSDIDLAASGGDVQGFGQAMEESLFTLLPFDVVDLDEGISAELQREIDRDGVILYDRV